MTTETEFYVDPRIREADNNRLALALFAGIANHSLPVPPNTYRPKAGSVADRVIAHLKTFDDGVKLSKRTLCETLDINIGSIDSALWRAEDAGLIVRGLREEHYTNVTVWSLPVKKKRRALTPAISHEHEEVAA